LHAHRVTQPKTGCHTPRNDLPEALPRERLLNS
jgi:hypothetical protein